MGEGGMSAEPRKPCPFCGGKADYYPSSSYEDCSRLYVYHKERCYLLALLREMDRSRDRDSMEQRVSYFLHDMWNGRVNA
jgi:hypothetical protein